MRRVPGHFAVPYWRNASAPMPRMQATFDSVSTLFTTVGR